MTTPEPDRTNSEPQIADTLDVALDWVSRYAITAVRAGATSDQLEAAVRRALLIARDRPNP